MDDDTQRNTKRTRRKKRSNGKRKTAPENDNFLSQESQDSTNGEDESPVVVKRVLRNRSINTGNQETVAKRRTRRRKKKKSITEETDNTEPSDVSPAKSLKSIASSSDDNRNTSKKYDSPLLRLKRRISYDSPPKQNAVVSEIEENKENDDVFEVVNKTKQSKLKKEEQIETPPPKKKITEEWTEASQHNFDDQDLDESPTAAKRGTYLVQKSTPRPFLPSSAVKQRKKWDLSNVSLTYSPTIRSTPENKAEKSSRSSTFRKTPFRKAKSIIKVNNRGKSTPDLNTSCGEVRSVRFDGQIETIDHKIETIDGKFETFDHKPKIKRRSYSLEDFALSRDKPRKSKVSFCVTNQEIVDSSFVSDDGGFKIVRGEDNELGGKENERRTFSFDGLEKKPVICKRDTDFWDKSVNKTATSLLNHSLLQETPSKVGKNESTFDMTDNSFVTRRRGNISSSFAVDLTSPPFMTSPFQTIDSPLQTTDSPFRTIEPINRQIEPTSTNHRTSLSKKLGKSKTSPQNKTKRLSTSLKASSKLSKPSKISGEAAESFLNLVAESGGTKKKIFPGGRPSGTSTPRPLRNTSLLKPNNSSFLKSGNGSLLKTIVNKSKKNITFDGSVTSSPSKIKRSKMPNFSMIHQKQFERMESISDCKERREERARVLLSGAKPPACYSTAKNSSSVALNNSTKTCNKQLFNVTSQPVASPSKMSKPSTPKPSTSNIPLLPEAKTKVLQRSRLPIVKKDDEKLTGKPKETKSKVLQSSRSLVAKKNDATARQKATIPKKVTVDKGNVTRFGFNKSTFKKSKEELVALANKSRVLKTDVQTRVNVLQGVRSNRRFELLMKMRNK